MTPWPLLELAFLRARNAYRRVLVRAKAEAEQLRAIEKHDAHYEKAHEGMMRSEPSARDIMSFEAERFEVQQQTTALPPRGPAPRGGACFPSVML